MKQILQNLQNGETELAEVPCPALPAGHLLVRTTCTLVSAGTERMLVDFGKANLIAKARQQPDKVRMVLDKARTDGIVPTYEAVRAKLDQPLPLGYCNVGRLLEIGKGVDRFKVGQRIVSNGNHAEIVRVPRNLCAAIPDSVSDEEAAFTVIAAVALQGIRLAEPTLGETVVVSGLGLVGLIAVQLLRAQGCRVLGLDFDKSRLALARRFGAEVVDLGAGADAVRAAEDFSRGIGADAVIITASTSSSEPVHQAAHMCRKRGRIVLVGMTGLELSRADFYEKELTFQVSCSYGPGRYDPNYEDRGQDYPVGFVRWTEQRNFEAVLDMIADGRLDLAPLITHRFEIGEAVKAYEVVSGSEPSLGVLLRYSDQSELPDQALRARTIPLPPIASQNTVKPTVDRNVTVAVIGAGNYSSRVLVPALQRSGAELRTIGSSGGLSGMLTGRKYGFAEATTDIDALFADDDVDVIVIATRHDTHAALACRALEAGKSVFIEKPLALNHVDIDAIERAYEAAQARDPAPQVMVGFNRRFAPLVIKMRQLLAGTDVPKAMVMTVNAGAIPADHWTQNRDAGGGRIIGEACHFVDLLRHLAGAPIVRSHIERMRAATDDTATIQLTFADGSTGTVHYFANGNAAFPKERLEVFVAGRILQLDNFRSLRGYGWPGFRKQKGWTMNKGVSDCVADFVRSVGERSAPPIPFSELLEISRAIVELAGMEDGS